MNSPCSPIRSTILGLAPLVHLRRYATLATLLGATTLTTVACGTTAAPDTVSEPDVPEDTGETPEDTQEASDAQGTDAVIGSDAKDTQDTTDVQADTDAAAEVDAGWECDKAPATECAGKFNEICETAECVDHVCTKAKKPGANVCCGDSDCSKLSCQTEKCNLTTGSCEYQPIPACCDGQEVVLQNEGFETQGTLAPFTSVTQPVNGNVKWHVSNKRAHSGKSSAYLGNECYNYDTSATAANSCQSTGQGQKAVVTLGVPLTIPLDKATKTPKATILTYWVWIDVEPSYLVAGSGITKGTKCPPCAADQICAKLADLPNDGCLTEKDVLTVQVNGQSVTPTIAWSSTKLETKSTGGVWQHHVINLAGFGAAPTVSWVFNTQDGLNNQFEGVYLDDIEAKTLCADDNTTCDPVKPCKLLNDCSLKDPAAPTNGVCTYFDNASDKGLCLSDNADGCCLGSGGCDDKNGCTVDTCNIEGSNTTGLCSNVPDAANTQCCQPVNLNSDAFENGLGAWTQKLSNSNNVQWRMNPTGGVGGSKAIVFTDATLQSYADKNLVAGPKGTVCSPEVTLKSGTLYNLASFKVKMQTEWCGQPSYTNPVGTQTACKSDGDCTKVGESCYVGKCAYNGKADELRVLFLTGGQFCGKSGCSSAPNKVAEPLWSSDVIKGCADPEFQPQFVALDQYAGNKGMVCFTFDSGDSSANVFTGPAIDDFKLDISCKKTEKPCASNAECDKYCDPTFELGVCSANECAKCEPIPGKCKDKSWCDDKNSCTTDTCAAGVCEYTTPDPNCCDAQTLIEGGESFEANKNTNLPKGWVIGGATTPESLWGVTYGSSIKWHVSGSNYFGQNSTDLYSLYFGNATLLNFEEPGKTAFGTATSPVYTVPSTGTTILTFRVALSTEWDAPATFAPVMIGGTEYPVDRLRVGVQSAADATKTVWVWNSSQVGGSTNSKWVPQAAEVPAEMMGKQVKLVFEFDAGTDKKNNYTGAYIDTLGFFSVCTPPACVTDAKCTPPSPDPCKSYSCVQNTTTADFSCQETFKPGPTCCQASTPLPAVTVENSLMAPLTMYATPGNLVKWGVRPAQKLNGKYELYMGNPALNNYADGGGAVEAELQSPILTVDGDAKKGALVTFTVWADIEQPLASGVHAENFALFAAYGASEVKIWDAFDKTSGFKTNQWKSKQTITVPLPPALKGQKIILKFRFDSGNDGVANADHEGISLDDIQFSEPCL